MNAIARIYEQQLLPFCDGLEEEAKPQPGVGLTSKSNAKPVAPNVLESNPSKQLGKTDSEPLVFQNELIVSKLFMAVVKERRIQRISAAHVTFRPFRSTLYSYKIKSNGSAIICFHSIFKQASDEVIKQASHLMLVRTRSARAKVRRGAYDIFVDAIPSHAFELPGARPVQKRAKVFPGKHRCLDDSFERVNDRYFDGGIVKPEICWSPRRAKRILGSYDEDLDRLIVSRIFDSTKVPLFVLDYLMYHELLHKHLGIGQRTDGKRCMHGSEFKRMERKYERFDQAVEFLKSI